MDRTYFIFQYHGDDKPRLDRVLLNNPDLAREFNRPTRSQIKLWIESGMITINGTPAGKSGAILRDGDTIAIDRQAAAAVERGELIPYEFKLNILYEDKWLLVVDKPAGLSVHPGAGNADRTMVNALVHHFAADASGKFAALDPTRPGIVHRLDKDTTGVIVVARDLNVQNQLSRQFADRTVGRSYMALVLSSPRGRRIINTHDEGKVDAAIGRHPVNRKEMTVLQEGGRSAVTNWRVLERMPHAALLEVRLDTGRTHQIRVHMNHIGSPVLGDQVYGNFSALPPVLKRAAQELGRQALHAFRLAFTHPISGERLEFESNPPEDLVQLIDAFRAEGG